MKPIPLVVIESPFLGGQRWAVLYARLALADQIRRGTVPFASHLLYPQALNDDIPEHRERGLEAGWVPYYFGATAAVYTDFGITLGMHRGVLRARRLHRAVEYFSFGTDVRSEVLDAAAHDCDHPSVLGVRESTIAPWPNTDHVGPWDEDRHEEEGKL